MVDIPNEVKALVSGKDIETRLKMVTECLDSQASYTYPFRCAPLNVVFGGGLLSGKLYEFSGWESSGKSTLALEGAFAFCDYWKLKKEKHAIVWIETESVFDKPRIEMIAPGYVGRFLVGECETVEEAEEELINSLTRAIASNTKLFIVWDTIAAAPTKKEKAGEASMGAAYKAFVIRSMLRKITPLAAQADATIIFVNQLSKSVGTFAGGDQTSGGGGIRFHASCRAKLDKKAVIKEFAPNGEEVPVGIITDIFTIKNKLAQPNQSVSLTIYGERGIGSLDTTARFLKLKKIVPLKGSWAEIKFPKSLFADGNRADPLKEDLVGTGWECMKFQSTRDIKNRIATKYPHLRRWIDYLVYRYNAQMSPLIKVRMIQTIWDMETEFFGEPFTALTGREIDAAKLIYSDVQKNPNGKPKEEAEKAEKVEEVSEVKTGSLGGTRTLSDIEEEEPKPSKKEEEKVSKKKVSNKKVSKKKSKEDD